MNPNTRIECKSFLMIRDTCQPYGAMVQYDPTDSYSSVDFRLNNSVRIQDKVGFKSFHFRNNKSYPYNPDDFDVLQLSNIEHRTVYAIPMRYQMNNLVLSTFSDDELMKTSLWNSKSFIAKNAKFYFRLDIKDDVIRYITLCETSAQISSLTDKLFYTNMLDKYKHKWK